MTSPQAERQGHLERLGPEVLRLLTRYLESAQAGHGPVVRLPPLAEIESDLGLCRGVAPQRLDDAGFLAFLSRYLNRTVRMQHPGYLAHQVAVPHDASALADLINGVTNNGMAIYEMGPGAVAVEMAVLDWMLALVGWPRLERPGENHAQGPFAGGVLTHGGSLANLTALLAARAAVVPLAWTGGNLGGDLAVLASPEAHYSISRAVGIMGLGTDAVLPVAADERQVIRPDGLPAAAARVRRSGRKIMALVASACSTGPGLYDPLEEIGQWCREEGVWFHVDAAHGAAALLSPRLEGRLRGLNMADSIIWDAHKMLRTSALCAAVLVRDGARLDGAFRQKASYIFNEGENPGVDLISRTVECTKAPLGLKVLLTLLLTGEDGLRGYVERQYDLTLRFHDIINNRPGFSCPFPPEANILCFRAPGDNAAQLRIRARLLAAGRFHLSSTEICGRRYLRMTVMGPQTGEDVVHDMLAAVEKLCAESEASSP